MVNVEHFNEYKCTNKCTIRLVSRYMNSAEEVYLVF